MTRTKLSFSVKSLFLLTSACILITSCGAIFGSRRATIRVNANVDSSTVYIDNKIVGVTPLTCKVKKKDDLVIRVEKPGYLKSNDIIVEKKTISGFIWADVLGSFATGIGIGLSIPNETVGALIMGAGSLLLMIPVTFIESGAGKALKVTKKSYDFNIAPQPDTVNKDLSKLILCEEFNFKINPGDKIGSLTINNKRTEPIKWTNTNNLQSEKFIVYINNEMEKIGHNVVGLGRNKKIKQTPKLSIMVEVKEVNLNLNVNAYSGVVNQNGVTISEPLTNLQKSEVKLNLNWKIVDNRTNETIYDKIIAGYSIKYKDELELALYDAIRYSLSTFLSDKDANNIVIEKKHIDQEFSEFDSTPVFITKAIPNKDVVKDKLQYATQSVVTIETDFGSGSGFIISENGYVITNAHVVEKAKKVNIIFSNGYSFTADVLKVSESSDLALLKINGSGFKPLVLLNESKAEVGSDIYAIGAPLGKDYSQSITKGIVSGYRIKNNRKYIQTDVSISPGNSGGPILNNNLEVIGVVQSKIIGEGVEGIGFCIPTEEVFTVLNIKYR